MSITKRFIRHSLSVLCACALCIGLVPALPAGEAYASATIDGEFYPNVPVDFTLEDGTNIQHSTHSLWQLFHAHIDSEKNATHVKWALKVFPVTGEESGASWSVQQSTYDGVTVESFVDMLKQYGFSYDEDRYAVDSDAVAYKALTFINDNIAKSSTYKEDGELMYPLASQFYSAFSDYFESRYMNSAMTRDTMKLANGNLQEGYWVHVNNFTTMTAQHDTTTMFPVSPELVVGNAQPVYVKSGSDARSVKLSAWEDSTQSWSDYADAGINDELRSRIEYTFPSNIPEYHQYKVYFVVDADMLKNWHTIDTEAPYQATLTYAKYDGTDVIESPIDIYMHHRDSDDNITFTTLADEHSESINFIDAVPEGYIPVSLAIEYGLRLRYEPDAIPASEAGFKAASAYVIAVDSYSTNGTLDEDRSLDSNKMPLYTYSLKLDKLDPATQERLSDVVFDVYEGDEKVCSMTTDAAGQALFVGLDSGTYTVVEAENPNTGYPSGSSFELTITADIENHTLATTADAALASGLTIEETGTISRTGNSFNVNAILEDMVPDGAEEVYERYAAKWESEKSAYYDAETDIYDMDAWAQAQPYYEGWPIDADPLYTEGCPPEYQSTWDSYGEGSLPDSTYVTWGSPASMTNMFYGADLGYVNLLCNHGRDMQVVLNVAGIGEIMRTQKVPIGNSLATTRFSKVLPAGTYTIEPHWLYSLPDNPSVVADLKATVSEFTVTQQNPLFSQGAANYEEYCNLALDMERLLETNSAGVYVSVGNTKTIQLALTGGAGVGAGCLAVLFVMLVIAAIAFERRRKKQVEDPSNIEAVIK